MVVIVPYEPYDYRRSRSAAAVVPHDSALSARRSWRRLRHVDEPRVLRAASESRVAHLIGDNIRRMNDECELRCIGRGWHTPTYHRDFYDYLRGTRVFEPYRFRRYWAPPYQKHALRRSLSMAPRTNWALDARDISQSRNWRLYMDNEYRQPLWFGYRPTMYEAEARDAALGMVRRKEITPSLYRKYWESDTNYDYAHYPYFASSWYPYSRYSHYWPYRYTDYRRFIDADRTAARIGDRGATECMLSDWARLARSTHADAYDSWLHRKWRAERRARERTERDDTLYWRTQREIDLQRMASAPSPFSRYYTSVPVRSMATVPSSLEYEAALAAGLTTGRSAYCYYPYSPNAFVRRPYVRYGSTYTTPPLRGLLRSENASVYKPYYHADTLGRFLDPAYSYGALYGQRPWSRDNSELDRAIALYRRGDISRQALYSYYTHPYLYQSVL